MQELNLVVGPKIAVMVSMGSPYVYVKTLQVKKKHIGGFLINFGGCKDRLPNCQITWLFFIQLIIYTSHTTVQ